MAKSGFRIAVGVVKAVNRAHKQSVREGERQRKQQAREDARLEREHEKNLRQQEKDQIAREKLRVAEEKALLKQEIENSKISYEARCTERQNLRDEFINK